MRHVSASAEVGAAEAATGAHAATAMEPAASTHSTTTAAAACVRAIGRNRQSK
jgi:hypothetical protein